MNPPTPDCRPALLHNFDDLPDPRVAVRCAYPLQEMLLVALCAVTSDADDWVHVAEWGAAKLEWLRRFLPFEAGVASHDTFSRVFAQLDSQRFEGGASMAHVVSAWHTGAGLTLGQALRDPAQTALD